jgi:hypothetical protein
MEPLNSSSYSNSLDLLRRFVPTPLRARFCAGKFWVTVETNDFALFPALPFDSEGHDNPRQNFHWKLVRDSDVTALLEEPMFVNSAGIRAVSMGPACLLGVDLERREIVGFIGAAVDAHAYRESLVPLLSRMSNDAFTGDPRANFAQSTGKATNV